MINKHLGVKSINLKCVRACVCVCVCARARMHVCVFVEAVEVEWQTKRSTNRLHPSLRPAITLQNQETIPK